MLELHFDVKQGYFPEKLADNETTLTLLLQGLTKADLMCELSHLLALPVYQLARLFTHEV